MQARQLDLWSSWGASQIRISCWSCGDITYVSFGPVPPPGVYAGYVAVNLMEIGILGQDEGQFESYKACQLAFRTY